MTPGAGAVQPHGELRELTRDVFCVDGTWNRSPLGRRMTVVRSAAGELAVHSAMVLRDEAMRQLDDLGRVTLVLVPNSFHASEAAAYRVRYPDARVLVPKQVRAKLAAGVVPSSDGTHEDDWPSAWLGELQAFPLDGLRNGEVAFWHVPSRTLVLTDLAFNVPATARGALRWMMKLNGGLGRFGPTRLLRWAFVRDRAALAKSLAPLLELDAARVVVSHGDVLERDGGQRMRDAFAALAR